MFDPERLLYIDHQMHLLYPGKYVIDETWSAELGKFILVPIFEDTAEETMWLLKYT